MEKQENIVEVHVTGVSLSGKVKDDANRVNEDSEAKTSGSEDRHSKWYG